MRLGATTFLLASRGIQSDRLILHKLTSRGLASFAIAGLLIAAPVFSTAAYADESAPDTAIVSETLPEAAPEVVPETAPEVAPETALEAADRIPEVVPETAPETTDPTPEVVEAPETGDVAAPPISSARGAQLATGDVGPGAGPYPLWASASAYGQVTVRWDAQPDDGGIYYVFIFDETLGGYILINGVTPTLFWVNYATPGHTYLINYRSENSFDFDGEVRFTSPLSAPDAPTDLQATRLATADGFDLAWNAPADSFNPVVYYSIDITDEGGTTSTVTSSTTSFVAAGLTLGSDYTFAVTAVSADGLRSDAAETSGQLSATSPTLPQNVTLAIDGDTLSGSWTAPAYDGGAAIQGYDVELYENGDVVYSPGDLVVGSPLVLDYEAEYGVEYTITVVAVGGDGDESEAATSSAVQRSDAAPAAATAFVEAYGYKTPMIYISWELAPQTGSAPDSFLVTLYDADGAVVQQDVLTERSQTGYNFVGLANDTAYSASVVVTNDAGSSPESNRAETRTLGLIPPAFTAEQLASYGGDVTASLNGEVLTAHIGGVEAGDWVFGYAYSSPAPLGWVQVGAGGFASWSIAGAGLTTGQTHTLAVASSFGDLFGSAQFAVPAPRAASVSSLAATGSDPSGLLMAAVGLLAAGVLVTVRRRSRA